MEFGYSRVGKTQGAIAKTVLDELDTLREAQQVSQCFVVVHQPRVTTAAREHLV